MLYISGFQKMPVLYGPIVYFDGKGNLCICLPIEAFQNSWYIFAPPSSVFHFNVLIDNKRTWIDISGFRLADRWK